MVYVDDLLMLCDHGHASRLWREIEQCITFSEPAAPIGKFLGANNKAHDENGVSHMRVDMVERLTSAVSAFEEELFKLAAGAKYRLKQSPLHLSAKISLPLVLNRLAC